MKKTLCFIVVLVLLMSSSAALAFDGRQLSDVEYEGYLKMKEIFPNEIQLVETIAVERNANTSSFDLTSSNQLLLESEKIIDGQYYHLMATRAGEVGFTERIVQGTSVSGGYNNARIRTRLYGYALNLLHGHEIITQVSYRSVAHGAPSNYIITSGTYQPSFVAWANCTGSPTKSASSSQVYWAYRGRSATDEFSGLPIYNNFRQYTYVGSSGLTYQAFLW